MVTAEVFFEEAGIDVWHLRCPRRLANGKHWQFSPEDRTQLLLVTPYQPEREEDILLVERVLTSINLVLGQAQHVFPSQFSQVNLSKLVWVWFSGCPKQGGDYRGNQTLISAPLWKLDHDLESKRQLWFQIQRYKKRYSAREL